MHLSQIKKSCIFLICLIWWWWLHSHHPPSISNSERSSILRMHPVYLLPMKLVSPPLVNPFAMLLSVWGTTLLRSPCNTSFYLLGLGLPTSSHPRELVCLRHERSHPSHISWCSSPRLVSRFPFWVASILYIMSLNSMDLHHHFHISCLVFSWTFSRS